MPIRVAVDAMGGDHAPEVVVQGAVRAADRAGERLSILLTGPEERLREEIGRFPSAAESIVVVDAPDVIEMGESPAIAVKRKKRSSIHVGLGACRSGQADAFVSSGNTGAVMAASLFILGRLPGVARPAILGLYPTLKGFCYVVDVGANVDCRAEHLVQFADMAAIYVERVLRQPNPSIALLNIGEEPSKGNDVVKEAYGLLKRDERLQFVGNIEGRDLMHHAADIVVCDGFVGNIILKLGESIATVVPEMVVSEMERREISGEDQKVVFDVLRGVKRSFDYEEYGGTPLLGIAGTVLIGHGGSSARAVENMILAAARVSEKRVTESIAVNFGDSSPHQA